MGTRVSPATSLFTDKFGPSISRLLEDLERLCEDQESADILFLVGRDEIGVYAHRLILASRCRSFQKVKRGEICKIPGCTVTPTAPGSPTTIRIPQFQSATFKEILLYVYTGKFIPQDSTVFETMTIAQDLGMDELRQMCEDHVVMTMSVHNACTFLAAASDMQGAARPFLDRCIHFIGENAYDCMKTSAFLNLSKDAVIQLISSDSLMVEEEDVWRGVLEWAKHQAGVTQPTAHWTEEERTRVCQQLSGVIQHVKLLLIDSQVFAEEVEPTGAVPMELSLERYRFAALPSKFAQNDKRIQPRMSTRLFQGSQILQNDKMHLQRLLNEWFGQPKQHWRLVYRASLHGYEADAFHRHCDGIAPTFVVVAGHQGHICGGYSDIAWEKPKIKGRHMASDKAFLFTLLNKANVPPTKFPIVKKMFAVGLNADNGPVFGGGSDLSICDRCDTEKYSYSNMPHSYNGKNASSILLMGEYNFLVLDYEVFTPIA